MRVLLLAVLFLLAFTPQAEARSYSVVTHLQEVEQLRSANSIALADGRVVWIEQRGTAAALVAAGENGVAHDLVVLAPAEGVERFHSVAASGQTAFVQRLACVKPSCSNGGDLLRVDLATGAAVPFDGCLDDGVCAGCPDGRFFALGLRGTVLSSHLSCSQQSAVTDLADGATRHLDGDVLDAVGDLAVVHTDAASSSTLTVRDWRTGHVVTVADGVDLGQLVQAVSIDADGTLAWADGTKLHMRAPGAKRDRVIALESGDAISDLKVAGGRVALRRSNLLDGNRFQVSGLDGSQPRRVDGQRGAFGWAFDGQRLAWVAQPCAQPVIQVWDLAGESPPPVTDHCIRPRIAARSLKLNRAGTRFKVKLTCPPAPARGCAGEIGADVLVDGRRRVETYWREYRIAPGGTLTETLQILRHARLRGATGLVARVQLDNYNTISVRRLPLRR